MKKEKSPERKQSCHHQLFRVDQVYLRVFQRKWNEPRREGPYKVVRATLTAVQVEGSMTWYHLNHSTIIPNRRTERERNRQADNSGERDEEKQEPQDEVQTEENSKKDSQGTHILLSGEEERRENKSDNMSEDHYMSSAPNNESTNSTNRKQPDFPAINFSTFEQQ